MYDARTPTLVWKPVARAGRFYGGVNVEANGRTYKIDACISGLTLIVDVSCTVNII